MGLLNMFVIVFVLSAVALSLSTFYSGGSETYNRAVDNNYTDTPLFNTSHIIKNTTKIIDEVVEATTDAGEKVNNNDWSVVRDLPSLFVTPVLATLKIGGNMIYIVTHMLGDATSVAASFGVDSEIIKIITVIITAAVVFKVLGILTSKERIS